MKYLLAPAAVALAIGTSSVPAKAQLKADAWFYNDSGNFLDVETAIEGAEDLSAQSGQADQGVQGGTVILCEGGAGSRRSDVLRIDIDENRRIDVKFRSDPLSKNSRQHCHDKLRRNEIDPTTNQACFPGLNGTVVCDVTNFFVPGVTCYSDGQHCIQIASDGTPPSTKTKADLITELKKSFKRK
jgi:hypothetical protein